MSLILSGRKVLAVFLSAILSLPLSTHAAKADDWRWHDSDRHEREEWREHEWREHAWREHEWREHYWPQSYIVYPPVQPYYYPAPQVVYAPPPPSYNVVIPLNIR